MLLPTILLLAVATQGLPTGPAMEECCSEKTVGGDRYINIGSDPGTAWEGLACLSACIFKKEGEDGSKYCFASGDMKVECKEDMEVTPRPGSPTYGPEMTAGPGAVTAGPGAVTAGPGAVTAAPGGPTGQPATTAPAPAGSCKCGVKKVNRIVGGAEATVNEYPWIAVFGDAQGDNIGGCASTLIANNWAVTASHCFFDGDTNLQNRYAKDFTVVLGIHDRTIVVTPDTPASLRKTLKIAELILHPQYKPETYSSANDIALLKLAEPVDLTTYTPACLPAKGTNYDGKNGWVYGWGLTEDPAKANVELAAKLQELEVPIVSDSVCGAAMDAEGVTISQDMLCAGGKKDKDACQGDSGGPLTVDVSGQHTLAGAVSFGIGCGKASLYGVYAEVSYFRDWIDSTIAAKGGATFCN